ncbi:MAG: restriction endonuclease [Nitrospirae bacterium]|nr:restriction endonuclease [Nitrospirota bacterium]
MKPKLTTDELIKEAKAFCERESTFDNKDLYGVTDGKAVGTFIEHKFSDYLDENYDAEIGSSANGIDMPSSDINTDIKVTSIEQPQSSCPFKNARQKIYGLGYNLLLFVYEKTDDPTKKVARLNFVSCSFIHKHRTADFQITKTIRQMLDNNANSEDIIAYLTDRNLPADEIMMRDLAEEILRNKPEQGYLTISNALQWRLQYGRVVKLSESVDGIVRIINKI